MHTRKINLIIAGRLAEIGVMKSLSSTGLMRVVIAAFMYAVKTVG